MVEKTKTIEIAKGVFWLGIYRGEQLELNVYLRRFKKDDKIVNMIIDPGPPIIFESLQQTLNNTIGNLKNVQFIFLNHQDPDVSMNAMYLLKYNPNIKIICSEDTWRLVNFMGFPTKNFQAVDKFKSLRGRLSTGHTIRFIPTPFCHFRGAVMLYDEETRVLFSGDLFGGLTYSRGLYATSINWHGMRIFHQIYMPSKQALQSAINSIRRLDPQPEIIAPQHGALIKGELISEFMDKLYELPVGLDLFQVSGETKEFYIEAINEIIETVSKRAGGEIVDRAMEKLNSDDSFPDLFEQKDGRIWDIKVDPQKTCELFIKTLQKDQPQQVVEIIKNAVLKASVDWNLPLYEAITGSELEDSNLSKIEEAV